MQNVLLLYPEMLFYKIPIFNKLSIYLLEREINLIVWAQDYQEASDQITFKAIKNLTMNRKNYRKVLKDNKIDKVINILFKSNPGYFFYLYSILYPKIKGKKIIFYGHGINKQSISPLSIFIYNLIHTLFDKIILYSPNERKYLWKAHHKKISVAYNTLDLEGRREMMTHSKDEVRELYNIKHKFLVLFSGRIQGRKKIDMLINVFEKYFNNDKAIGLVIVGGGMSPEINQRIEKLSNVYYLGPIYETLKMSQLFHMSDVFCVPGALGLGIVEAIYWGLPVITTNVNHGPESFYLQNGKNSLIVDSEEQLAQGIRMLMDDPVKLNKMKLSAISTYEKSATLNNMFEGFTKALIKKT